MTCERFGTFSRLPRRELDVCSGDESSTPHAVRLSGGAVALEEMIGPERRALGPRRRAPDRDDSRPTPYVAMQRERPSTGRPRRSGAVSGVGVISGGAVARPGERALQCAGLLWELLYRLVLGGPPPWTSALLGVGWWQRRSCSSSTPSSAEFQALESR